MDIISGMAQTLKAQGANWETAWVKSFALWEKLSPLVKTSLAPLENHRFQQKMLKMKLL